ncbi:hypothetical protein BJ912DRAFT_931746 [Pholiota molesta]|nr:hypothetical protein BJ912DRAFT_931746 [Pholiota molesta]
MSASSPSTRFQKLQMSRCSSLINTTLMATASLRGGANSARIAYQMGGRKRRSAEHNTNPQQAMSASSPNTQFQMPRMHRFFSPVNRTLKALASIRGSANSAHTQFFEATYVQIYRGARANGDHRHSVPPDVTHCLDPRLAIAFEMQRNRGPRESTSITFPSQKHGGTKQTFQPKHLAKNLRLK